MFNWVGVDRSAMNYLSTGKISPEVSTSDQEGKSTVGANRENALTFVDDGAKVWRENRKKWLADQPQRRRVAKDPIISWSTAYEDLLSTHEPFSKPIPLPEMVDFLVDIWYDEGLFDWEVTAKQISRNNSHQKLTSENKEVEWFCYRGLFP